MNAVARWLACGAVLAVAGTALGQPPAKTVGEIEPPKLDGPKVERMSPSTIEDACLGGNGRYLFVHQPASRKIACFDVNTADFVHSFPADDDNVRFCAGADRLVIVLANSGTVQRYNLATMEREKTLSLPSKAKVEQVTMGYASKGPMLVTAKDVKGTELSFFVNVYTMQAESYALPRPTDKVLHFGAGPYVRVSADNKVFTKWSAHTSPQHPETLRLAGTKLVHNEVHDTHGHATPSPDGRIIYTGHGTFTPEWKKLSKHDTWCIPAVASTEYYCTVTTGRKEGTHRLAIHFGGDERPLATLDDLDLPKVITQWDREPFTADKRIFFIPDADVIVTIPETADRVVVNKFDLDEALKTTELDYLVVTSKAPKAVTRRGNTYKYALVVKSKKGGVTYRVESGPKGLAVSDTGEVTWRIPNDFALSKREVIIALKDSTGNETFHKFNVYVSP